MTNEAMTNEAAGHGDLTNDELQRLGVTAKWLHSVNPRFTLTTSDWIETRGRLLRALDELVRRRSMDPAGLDAIGRASPDPRLTETELRDLRVLIALESQSSIGPWIQQHLGRQCAQMVRELIRRRAADPIGPIGALDDLRQCAQMVPEVILGRAADPIGSTGALEDLAVIFLDIDGVLNHEEVFAAGSAWWRPDPQERLRIPVAPACVDRLNRLIAETQARVVISSSWRKVACWQDLGPALARQGLVGQVIGETPDLAADLAWLEAWRAQCPEGDAHVRLQRGMEIAWWLARHPGVRSFVILDDSADMAHLDARLVLTDPLVGLTDADVERAKVVLARRAQPDELRDPVARGRAMSASDRIDPEANVADAVWSADGQAAEPHHRQPRAGAMISTRQGERFEGLLTYAECQQAARNVGVDLQCGACGMLFFTGFPGHEHDAGCRTKAWSTTSSQGCRVCAGTLYYAARARGDGLCSPRCRRMAQRTGVLIAIEGIDGAGTTTQALRLAGRLIARGGDVHLTREPSDGPIGRLIREMLAGGHAVVREEGVQAIAPATLGLLFAADRMDHLQREVEPRLAAGGVVVSDRWYHSSLAYQGSEEDRRWIATLNDRARVPELTIFLRVSPEVAARRRVAAGRAHELFDDLQTQIRVDAGYRAAIDELIAHGERVELVDGELDPDRVAEEIARVCSEVLAPDGVRTVHADRPVDAPESEPGSQA